MLLLCLKLFCDLLTPPGTVGRMGLQAKTMNYVLEMLGLTCLWNIQLGQMHREVIAGEVTRAVLL